jgi:hypothetical protein
MRTESPAAASPFKSSVYSFNQIYNSSENSLFKITSSGREKEQDVDL